MKNFWIEEFQSKTSIIDWDELGDVLKERVEQIYVLIMSHDKNCIITCGRAIFSVFESSCSGWYNQPYVRLGDYFFHSDDSLAPELIRIKDIKDEDISISYIKIKNLHRFFNPYSDLQQ